MKSVCSESGLYVTDYHPADATGFILISRGEPSSGKGEAYGIELSYTFLFPKAIKTIELN